LFQLFERDMAQKPADKNAYGTVRHGRKVGSQWWLQAGWSKIVRPGRSRLESRLQAGSLAPEFVSAHKEAKI
jgi:hypothetical protein